MRRTPSIVSGALMLLVLSSMPLIASAGTQADAMCNPVIPSCPCNFVPNPNPYGPKCIKGVNWFMCPGYCKDTEPGGVVTGVCMAENTCKGTSASGLDGKMGDIAGLSSLAQSVAGILKSLMGGSGSGSGSGSSPSSGGAPTSGCASYYSETTNPAPTDPCAFYVAPVSSTLGTTSNSGVMTDLLSALNNGSGSANASSQLLSTLNNTNTDTNVNSTPTDASAGTSPVTVLDLSSSTSNTINTNGAGLTGGVTGNIQTDANGATVITNNQDLQNNTETSGFYGGNTLGGQSSQGLVSQWCGGRPWANNFLSALITPTFFDGLCSLAGYQVGSTPVVAQQQSAVQKQVVVPAKTTTPLPAATTTNAIPPKVQIWAVPATVSLGTRTSIFWNSQGVSQCTETSPDGSFNQTSVAGGASTVPLTAATTFTISCIAPDGSHVTDYATVSLAI